MFPKLRMYFIVLALFGLSLFARTQEEKLADAKTQLIRQIVASHLAVRKANAADARALETFKAFCASIGQTAIPAPDGILLDCGPKPEPPKPANEQPKVEPNPPEAKPKP